MIGRRRLDTHFLAFEQLGATVEASAKLELRCSRLKGADVFIVTVPTPVTADNKPDLSPLMSACKTVGAVMGKGAIVVFESTVYPGLTDDMLEFVVEPRIERVDTKVCSRFAHKQCHENGRLFRSGERE